MLAQPLLLSIAATDVRDLGRICQIERACFEEPWDFDAFYAALQQQHLLNECLLVKAETNATSSLEGFVCYAIRKDGFEILNIAIAPAMHRNGLGTFIVGKIKNKLRPGGKKVVDLWVRERNLGAQLFFQANGFRCTRVERKHYDTAECGYYFRFSL